MIAMTGHFICTLQCNNHAGRDSYAAAYVRNRFSAPPMPNCQPQDAFHESRALLEPFTPSILHLVLFLLIA